MSNNAQVSKAISEASQQVPPDSVLTSDFFRDLIASEESERLVHVDAWEGAVRITKVTASDRLSMFSKGEGERTSDGWQFSVVLLSKTIRDADGQKPFDTDEGRAYLERLDTTTLIDLASVAMEFNGFRSDEKTDAAKKNGSQTR